MKSVSLALAAVLLAPSIARADDAPTYKDPDNALIMSGGGTALSLGLVVAASIMESDGDDGLGEALGVAGGIGMLVAPSLGHWYARDYVSAGLVMRVVGTGLGAYALYSFDHCLDSGNGCTTGSRDSLLLLSGAALTVGGAIVDIATARSAAREYNTKHNLTLTPTMMRTPSGTAAGVGFSGSF